MVGSDGAMDIGASLGGFGVAGRQLIWGRHANLPCLGMVSGMTAPVQFHPISVVAEVQS